MEAGEQLQELIWLPQAGQAASLTVIENTGFGGLQTRPTIEITRFYENNLRQTNV